MTTASFAAVRPSARFSLPGLATGRSGRPIVGPGILAIVGLEERIELRMARAQLDRLLEKALRDHSEELGRALGAVGIDQRELPSIVGLLERLELALKDRHPFPQLSAALELDGLGYVALGPVFPTESKKDPEPPVSLTILQRAYELAQKRGCPLVAIGGITEASLSEVSQASDLVAAISMVLPGASETRPYTWVRDRAGALAGPRLVAPRRRRERGVRRRDRAR